MTGKTDHRTTDTKERIIKEAIEAYREGGYTQINLVKIADTLGVKRPALYYHFPGGKEQLLIETMETFASEQAKVWEKILQDHPDTRTRLKKMLLSVTGLPFTYQELSFLETEEISDQTRHHIFEVTMPVQKLLHQLLDEGVTRGELRVVNRTLTFLSFGGLCRQADRILHLRLPLLRKELEQSSPDNLIDELVDLWLYGLAKP